MNRYLAALSLAVLTAFVTGCPRNEYLIELTPRGDVIERQLTFYRADGADTNGAPNYQEFPGAELAAIQVQYPPGAVKTTGKRHVARGEFAGALPKDVGGAGTWTNLVTSLGGAALYAERVRGSDDLASTSVRRLAAMDKLTDLLIGWSQAELGREPHYESLRKFLNEDFRRDARNFSLYLWVGAIAGNYSTNAESEFVVRFGQYLVERDYVTVSQLPELLSGIAENDYAPVMKIIRALVAKKLGLPAGAPLPATHAFLADDSAAGASFEKYLAASDAYKTRLSEWEKEKQSNPDADKPKPEEVAVELLSTALDWKWGGNPNDRLTVKLAVPAAPLFTNGRWDATNRVVVWEAEIDDRESPRLPVFCYANWVTADQSFQKTHFGRRLLDGEELLRYCLWRHSLTGARATEWDNFLLGLSPGDQLVNQLKEFRFSDDAVGNESAARPAKDLLEAALTKSGTDTAK